MSEEIRLQKYFSDCGILSRRAAEAAILAGEITVNGIPAVMGQKIDPAKDEIRYKRKIIKPQLVNGERKYTYIMLHKPIGYVTTLSDEKDRPTVRELLKDTGKRLYPVGRLDMYSDGLLLCTDDGDLTNKLTHPSHEIPKIYLATLAGKLTGQEIKELGESIELDGYKIKPVEVQKITDRTVNGNPATTVQFTLYEGRNRQIRRMCAYHDRKVLQLTRIRMGELDLGTLPAGKWRYLTEDEIRYLKEIH